MEHATLHSLKRMDGTFSDMVLSRHRHGLMVRLNDPTDLCNFNGSTIHLAYYTLFLAPQYKKDGEALAKAIPSQEQLLDLLVHC